jgi:hypothetical protein
VNRELMLKRPAEVVSARPLNLPVLRLVPVERRVLVPEPYRRPRTPADWPAYIWVPLLCARGVLLAAILIGLIYALS